MDAIEFFLLHHRRTSSMIEDRLSGLSDAQMRLRPHPHMNSIAWLLWHMARTEDLGMNTIILNRPQVLEEESWFQRLNLARRDIGTGMTDEEVADFSARVDIAALLAYCAAVGRRTQEAVGSLRPEDLDEVPDAARLRRVFAEKGAFGPNAAWVAELYEGKSKGWLLGQVGLTHPRGHFMQAIVVRKMQGLGTGGRSDRAIAATRKDQARR